MSPALDRALSGGRARDQPARRSAVRRPSATASIYRVSPEVQQHDRDDRLPLGTRGGTLVRHVFPLDAEYEIKVDLGGGPAAPAAATSSRSRIDGAQVSARSRRTATSRTVRVPVTARAARRRRHLLPDAARSRRAGARAVRESRPPRPAPAGIAGRLPSVSSGHDRRSAQREGPGRHAEPPPAVHLHAGERRRRKPPARRPILTTLARRAYRGAVDARAGRRADDVLSRPGRAESGQFDDGIELALRRLLVSPEFLYRIETDPTAVVRGLQARWPPSVA